MNFDARRVAEAAGGRLVAGDPDAPGPQRAVVDSRAIEPGDLFVGLPGEHVDGGDFAHAALDAGAWGVLVGKEQAERLTAPTANRQLPTRPVVAVDDPLRALQLLAREWRRELDCSVIGVTGSTGKTSTKDILHALLGPQLRTHANRENLNTEIGLPLSLLEAPEGTEALVLEMAMRGVGQIAELVAIAEPDVGLIVNIGPVHLELLGTVEHVAAAKAEIIRDLPSGATCVVPKGEPLLEAHLRDDLDTLTFGPGGDVQLASLEDGHAVIDVRGRSVELELPFSEAYNVDNTLAAVAAATAIGVWPSGALDVRFSSLRGELVELDGVTVVNDCYNANPMSMRAALDSLAEAPAERRVAVLGWMAELGTDADRYHREIGGHAAERGVDVLIAVGDEAARLYGESFGGELLTVASPEEAAELLQRVMRSGDRVLIKASRSAGLERVLGAMA